jgi:hypothetical protein
MYALFAKEKKNKITNIDLKKVLSNSGNIRNFSDLQSKIETDTAYTVTLTDRLVKKNTLNTILENSLSGLFFIKKLDVDTKSFKILIPSMLFSDYKGYMKAFKKEFKDIKKSHLKSKTKLSREIHDMLALKKLDVHSMINRMVMKLLPSSKFPSNFSMSDMKGLEKVLDKKGKKGACIKSYDKYFKVSPDPCKNYFRLDIKNLSTRHVDKIKHKKLKKRKRKRRKSKMKIKVGNISGAMGKPKIKIKKLKMTRTEKKMRKKNKRDKRNKRINKVLKKQENKIKKKEMNRSMKKDAKKKLKKLMKSVKKISKIRNVPKSVKKEIKKRKIEKKLRRRGLAQGVKTNKSSSTQGVKTNKSSSTIGNLRSTQGVKTNKSSSTIGNLRSTPNSQSRLRKRRKSSTSKDKFQPSIDSISVDTDGFEYFSDQLKINKKDNFIMVLFRAIILTVIILTILNSVNQRLYKNIIDMLKIPAKMVLNNIKVR